MLKVFAEFTRVASKNLEQTFFDCLDQHIPRFCEIFKAKSGSIGKKLSDILHQVQMRVSSDGVIANLEQKCKYSTVYHTVSTPFTIFSVISLSWDNI